jgi:hypothetical protein
MFTVGRGIRTPPRSQVIYSPMLSDERLQEILIDDDGNGHIVGDVQYNVLTTSYFMI